MKTERPKIRPTEDPDAGLEQACLHELPEELVRELMTEASVYASGKLTEIEARAAFVEEVHGLAVQA
jgi:hypothetical protein